MVRCSCDLTFSEVQGLLRYNPETGIFHRTAGRCVGDIAGTLHKFGYWQIGIHSKIYKAHRLAWLMMTGEWPIKFIDHINGDRADNRWCNLREATNSQNMMNGKKHSDNSSGFKGVKYDKRRKVYYASIQVDGKTLHLGSFKIAKDAYAVYCAAAIKYHGEFARLD